MVTPRGRLWSRAAQVPAANSVSAIVKTPTVGQASVGTCSQGSGRAWRDASGWVGTGAVAADIGIPPLDSRPWWPRFPPFTTEPALDRVPAVCGALQSAW